MKYPSLPLYKTKAANNPAPTAIKPTFKLPAPPANWEGVGAAVAVALPATLVAAVALVTTAGTVSADEALLVGTTTVVRGAAVLTSTGEVAGIGGRTMEVFAGIGTAGREEA